MTMQIINNGAFDNDPAADDLRVAWGKAIANFSEIYSIIGGASPLASLASPVFTGTPQAPTAPVGTNTQQIATTAFVTAAIAALIGGAPGSLDTLKELADAINDDASYAATIVTALAGKQPLSSELTALAALTGTSFGRSFLTLADASAARTLLALGTAALADKVDFRKSPPIPSGKYVAPSGIGTINTTGVAPGANTMKMFLGYVRKDIVLTGLGMRVSTASASGNFQAAIYAMDPVTGWPTGAPLVTSANLSTTTATGVTDTTINVSLPCDWYWFATNCDNSTAAAYSLATTGGASDLTGASTATNTAGVNGQQKASVTFGTWPTLTGNAGTDGLTDNVTATMPAVFFKR